MTMTRSDVLNPSQIPKADVGLNMVKRRVKQFYKILTSRRLGSDEEMFEAMIERYGTAPELAYYDQWAHGGLVACEISAIRELQALRPSARKLLMVGCGTGREAFAFEKLGFQVTGIDVCGPMIESAKRIAQNINSQCQFHVNEPFKTNLNDSFDLVWVSGSLGNHIHGRSRRILFWKSLHSSLKSGGLMAHGPEIKALPIHSRFYWASQLLRYRWRRQSRWEKGDTAQSFLGNHNATSEPIFYHYYPDPKSFLSELQAAGFTEVSEPHPPMWIFRRSQDLWENSIAPAARNAPQSPANP